MNTADAQGMLDAAQSEGEKKGLKKGLKKGHEKGLKEGEKKKALEFACKLLKRNRPIEEIAEDTGLSVEEIQNLTR